MFAVIETGGKQYKVQYGDVIYVEKLAANEDETVTFPVVAICGEDGTKIGTPYVEGASVTGKVLKNGKAKKVTILTYKPKKGEKRKMGFFRKCRRSASRFFRAWPFRSGAGGRRHSLCCGFFCGVYDSEHRAGDFTHHTDFSPSRGRRDAV